MSDTPIEQLLEPTEQPADPIETTAEDVQLHVQPDPPDDRDQCYPPDLSTPTGHYESEERARLRLALEGDPEMPLTEAMLESDPAAIDDEAPSSEDSWVVVTASVQTADVEELPTIAYEEATIIEAEADDGAHECLRYRELADPAWRQRGQECTGFALAAIANYHLRKDLTLDEWRALSTDDREKRTVSRRMLYEMAQVYDQSDYVEGSTLRGALKGWNRAGVAADRSWPYEPDDEFGEKHGSLTMSRVLDAVARPGGLYLRVDQTDRAAMQDALDRGFPLFSSARTHVGWFDLYMPGRHIIERPMAEPLMGAHAFVMYGYDDTGWLMHNSWGPEWGDRGYAVLPYDDFDATGQDVWFVFEPRHVEYVEPGGSSRANTMEEAVRRQVDADEMWLHRVSLGDDGGLSRSGRFGMNPDEVGTLLYLFRQRTRHWKRRRLAIFVDGGYRDPGDTLASLRPFCDQLMAQEIYPLFLVWDTPWFEGLRGWLYGEAAASPDAPLTSGAPDGDPIGSEGADDTNADLAEELSDMWNVLSKFLVAQFSAPRVWRQLHANARAACEPGKGAAWILADRLAYNLNKASFDVHLIGHGTGDFLLSQLAGMIPTRIETCQLWSPITTMDQFAASYSAMLDSEQLRHLHVVTLSAAAERADFTGPVPGSVVQLASQVLEVDDIDLDTAVEDRDGTLRWTPTARPLLGLESTIGTDARVTSRLGDGTMSATSIATGTHAGLVTDPDVWRATIDSLTASAAPPVDDPAAPKRTGPARQPRLERPVDPLDWVISRSRSK